MQHRDQMNFYGNHAHQMTGAEPAKQDNASRLEFMFPQNHPASVMEELYRHSNLMDNFDGGNYHQQQTVQELELSSSMAYNFAGNNQAQQFDFLAALEPRRIPTSQDNNRNDKAPSRTNQSEMLLQLFTRQQQSLQHLQASLAKRQNLIQVTAPSGTFAVTPDLSPGTTSAQPLQGRDGQQADQQQHALMFPRQTEQHNCFDMQNLLQARQRQHDLQQHQKNTSTALMNLLKSHQSQFQPNQAPQRTTSAPVQPSPISGDDAAAARRTTSPAQAQPATSQHQGPMLLYMATDDEVLSEYQILLRKNIEYFAATMEDVETNTPGRKKAVTLGQVGIRCKYCAKMPIYRRSAATVYFPASLRRLYQSAQNIALTHFENSCECIPPHIRAKFKAHHANGKKAAAGHGGKLYWAHGATAAGVLETADGGLRFASDLNHPAEGAT